MTVSRAPVAMASWAAWRTASPAVVLPSVPTRMCVYGPAVARAAAFLPGVLLAGAFLAVAFLAGFFSDTVSAPHALGVGELPGVFHQEATLADELPRLLGEHLADAVAA